MINIDKGRTEQRTVENVVPIGLRNDVGTAGAMILQPVERICYALYANSGIVLGTRPT
jgi:hypothetical protein